MPHSRLVILIIAVAVLALPIPSLGETVYLSAGVAATAHSSALPAIKPPTPGPGASCLTSAGATAIPGPEADPPRPTDVLADPQTVGRPDFTILEQTEGMVTLRVKDTLPQVQAEILAALGPEQYACLDRIFWNESRWNPSSVNTENGACGLGQASPCTKLSEIVPDWPWNPRAQVAWFLDYINRRYGSPCGAWAFWQQNNWY